MGRPLVTIKKIGVGGSIPFLSAILKNGAIGGLRVAFWEADTSDELDALFIKSEV